MMLYSRRHLLQSAISAVGAASACGFAPAAAFVHGRAPFSIGLVADAQYANSDSKGTRFYRRSLSKLGAAVEQFNGQDLAFCVHLGDLIDHTWDSFDEILEPLSHSRHSIHHLLGNHDFDVAEQYKPRVAERMQLPARYYSLDHAGFRFIALDTNDNSVYAWPQNSPQKASAAVELRRLQDKKVGQAQSWNGGIGERQLEWFHSTCRGAHAAGLKVVVFSHHPVSPENVHNLWNCDQVLQQVDRHPHIVAWFNGHNHAGNFTWRHGVPYVTMHGMVETEDTTAFAVAEFHSDRINLVGQGREPSRELIFGSRIHDEDNLLNPR